MTLAVRHGWSNWSGTERSGTVVVAAPRHTEEVAALLRRASASGTGVRPVGSGHSFTGLATPRAPGDVLLRLDALDAPLEVDTATGLVTVQAGMRLRALNRGLAARGLAMTNLGDIEEQTVAGAIGTGTHGTGLRFGGLASQVRGLQLVRPDGQVLDCSPTRNADVYDLARIGLGALGVVTAVTLQTEPLFALHAREGAAPLDDVLERFDHDVATTDHVEFYWFPHTRRTLTKHNTRVPLDAGLDPLPRLRAWWDDELLANGALGALVGAGRRVPTLVRPGARVAARALGPREHTDLSYRVFTSTRRVRFVETEYAVPREALVPLLRELVARVERSDWRISFPVEVRVAAADDVPLSTAYGRESAYVAAHVAPGCPDREAYFGTLERLAGEVGGRPHWGKLHGLDADGLRALHPRFDEFVASRDRHDPQGVLANAHLDRVLGAVPGAVSVRSRVEWAQCSERTGDSPPGTPCLAAVPSAVHAPSRTGGAPAHRVRSVP